MAKIIVLGTGGTIASRGFANAVASSSVAELVAPLAPGAHIEARDVMTVGSYNLGLAQMHAIATAALAAAAEPGVDGVVVTHGTDTMEETAYLAELLYDQSALRVPVVFTGAQFAADTVAPDGARNLADAVAFAAHPDLRDVRVGIAFGGELCAARGSQKQHTAAPSPFCGGALLARRRGNDVSVIARPRIALPALTVDAAFGSRIIDVIMAAPGSDTALFETACARSAAVVLVGTGIGNAGQGFADAVARATAAGTPVVLSTRVPFGPVTPLYGNGGGVDIVRSGAVPAAELSHAQARVLAAVLLADPAMPHRSISEFSQKFTEYAA